MPLLPHETKEAQVKAERLWEQAEHINNIKEASALRLKAKPFYPEGLTGYSRIRIQPMGRGDFWLIGDEFGEVGIIPATALGVLTNILFDEGHNHGTLREYFTGENLHAQKMHEQMIASLPSLKQVALDALLMEEKITPEEYAEANDERRRRAPALSGLSLADLMS